jgi:hypothetical protein
VILDAEKIEPVTFLQFNEDAPNQHPIKKIDNDYWELTFDKIVSPGHEVGFSPDGRFMMNNLRENNCSVFDSSDPEPRNWKKIARIKDPLSLARQISEPVPYGLLDGQLQARPLDPPPLPCQQRRDGGRHQNLEDQ